MIRQRRVADTRRTPAVAAGRTRSMRLVAALAVISVLGAACGLPYDSSPRALNGELPPALANLPPSATTTTQPQCSKGPACAYAHLFYVQIDAHSSNLELVQLLPQPLPPPLTIPEVLRALQDGPPLSGAATTDGSVETDLPVGSHLQWLGTVHGVAHISADSAFYDQESAQAELEFGQIVYTLITTALGVTAVQFYFGGSVTSVVNASGQVVTGTVDQSDYCGETTAGCPTQPTTTTKPAKKGS